MPTISTLTAPTISTSPTAAASFPTQASRTQPSRHFTSLPRSPRRKPARSAVIDRSYVPVDLPNSSTPDSNSSLNNKPIQNIVPIQNRISILLVHIPIFSIRGQARLAEEIGVSRSTISRLAHGKINPSYRLARAVTDVLERRMGRPLDIREVFSTDGTYPTPSGCSLCQCHGCLPSFAWGTDNSLKPDWQDERPGDWSMARPSGSSIGSHTDAHRGAGKEIR